VRIRTRFYTLHILAQELERLKKKKVIRLFTICDLIFLEINYLSTYIYIIIIIIIINFF